MSSWLSWEIPLRISPSITIESFSWIASENPQGASSEICTRIPTQDLPGIPSETSQRCFLKSCGNFRKKKSEITYWRNFWRNWIFEGISASVLGRFFKFPNKCQCQEANLWLISEGTCSLLLLQGGLKEFLCKMFRHFWSFILICQIGAPVYQ